MMLAKYVGKTCLQFEKDRVYSIESHFDYERMTVSVEPGMVRPYKSLEEFYDDWEIVKKDATTPMTIKAEYVGKEIHLIPGNEYDVNIRTIITHHNHRKTVVNTVTVYDGIHQKQLTYSDLNNLATDWKLIK